MLQPLTVVFRNAIKIPSSSRFAWIRADTADVNFPGDYRWMQSQITSDDFLCILEEGQVVHLPAQINHFSRVDAYLPVFATSISATGMNF